MYYETKHFKLEELVPRALFEAHKDRPQFLWRLFDPRLLLAADALRDHYGVPLTCNDWSWGGRFQGRGFRPADYGTGAEYSQHKFGRAMDVWPGGGLTGKDMQQDALRSSGQPPFEHVTCIEVGVNHFHFDIRNHDRERHGILVVRP